VAARAETFISKPATAARSVLAEAGDIAQFSARAFRYAPGASRHFAEILRQTSLLIVGSTLFLTFLVMSIGSECALWWMNLSRPLGGTDFIGFIEVPCGINELYPLVMAYAFAAKVGTGLVAEIGAMRITDEIDALESVGTDPMRYVIGTRLVAVLIFVPAAFALAIIGGLIGGWLSGVVHFGELTSARYFEGYWTGQDLVTNLESTVKALSMTLGVALISMYYGYRARGGAVGVGNAVARSMFVSLLWIEFIAMCWSALFFGHGARFPFGG